MCPSSMLIACCFVALLFAGSTHARGEHRAPSSHPKSDGISSQQRHERAAPRRSQSFRRTKIAPAIHASSTAQPGVTANVRDGAQTTRQRHLRSSPSSSSKSKSSPSRSSERLKTKALAMNPFRMMNVTITNLSVGQPFSSFFVMVYDRNDDIDDALGIEEPSIFHLGRPASPALRRLAEQGDPTQLVETLGKNSQVFGIEHIKEGLRGGESLTFQVPDSSSLLANDQRRSAKRRITIAAKLQNTNDGFAALNGAFYRHRSTLYAPAYDAGTEENNESCASVPGPACSNVSGNVDSGNGEGYVHIHRGISGRGNTLTVDDHDWKNPIMEVEFKLV